MLLDNHVKVIFSKITKIYRNKRVPTQYTALLVHFTINKYIYNIYKAHKSILIALITYYILTIGCISTIRYILI